MRCVVLRHSLLSKDRRSFARPATYVYVFGATWTFSKYVRSFSSYYVGKTVFFAMKRRKVREVRTRTFPAWWWMNEDQVFFRRAWLIDWLSSESNPAWARPASAGFREEVSETRRPSPRSWVVKKMWARTLFNVQYYCLDSRIMNSVLWRGHVRFG